MGKHTKKNDAHDHDHGLAHDLLVMSVPRGRRQVLKMLAGASVVSLLGCGDDDGSDGDDAANNNTGSGENNNTGDDSTNTGDTSNGSGANGSSDTCETIPEEGEGPYPGDGSKDVNTLTESGIVRSDIRDSFGSYSGRAEGVLLTVKLKIVDTGSDCAALAGYAVYLWHCDREGLYSLYTAPDQNFLRGVQETDKEGNVTFTTIFPGAYLGRWPHMHIEIYPSLDAATNAGNKLKTSQLALPEDVCNRVYTASGYELSMQIMPLTTLASDHIFADGAALQLAEVTGSMDEGFVAALTVGFAA